VNGHPAGNAGGRTVGAVENPRFAAHLPAGRFLDWAWEHHPSRRTQFHATPGVDALRRAWDQIGDDEIARIAGTSDDRAVLEWIAAAGIRRAGVRSAIVRNPALPYETLLAIVERGTNASERDGIANTRNSGDLCRLLLAGHVIGGDARRTTGWIVSAAGELAEAELAGAIAQVPDDHRGTLAAEILRTDPETGFALDPVLDLLEDDANTDVPENAWRNLGAHLAARGNLRQIRRALAASGSTSLRAVLVEKHRITLTQAFARLDADHRLAVLRQIGTERLITGEEAPAVAAVAANGGGTDRATRSFLHGLRYEPEAVNWFVANASPVAAGTVVWHTDSDAVLISALRRNPESHQLAGGHVWRVGRVWERLSAKTRASIVATFDAMTLSNLAPGAVRDWIVGEGPVTAVGGLNLKKTEQRTLMDRVERERDPELAWVAARVAERPRDRVRMAEIGLASATWTQGLKPWLRGATSGEITRLWAAAPQERRGELGALLVANLRAGDEHSWLDRLIPELSIDWQSATASVQEAAAHWLSTRGGTDPDVWAAVWSLYPEWTGTLPELVETAANL